jgi:hypothetical protein
VPQCGIDNKSPPGGYDGIGARRYVGALLRARI